MEFWGIEVKPGQPIKTNPGANHLIHLSQASLSESKNKSEAVALYVNVDGKKLVLGTLTQQNGAHLSFDLVFEKEFELSHNSKNGSVYFLGYKADMPEEGDDEEIDSEDVSSEEEEELPVVAAGNGKPKVDAKTTKANAAGKPNAVKQGVKIAEPSKNDEDDSDSEDGSGSDDEDDSEDEDNEMSMDGSSDDEETPKKVESSKKRPAEAPTPVSGKKAKSAVTPQKTDGKKGGHVATPHPSKTAAKTSGKSPKSGGQFNCGTCSKTFGSGGGLESHKKAKHGGK